MIEIIIIYILNDCVDLTKLHFQELALPIEEKTGFGGYLRDSATVKKQIPPVSLSENYLDFGKVIPDEGYDSICHARNCLTLVTCLTNHLDKEIEVTWETGECRCPKVSYITYTCSISPN